NTASNVGAHMRLPFMGAYAASKAAVSALTRAAAKEYAGDGIRVNAISPGPLDTPMSMLPGETESDRAERMKDALPAGRVGTLAEAASAVLWLASPESAFTLGHDLVVDGGAAACPAEGTGPWFSGPWSAARRSAAGGQPRLGRSAAGPWRTIEVSVRHQGTAGSGSCPAAMRWSWSACH